MTEVQNSSLSAKSGRDNRDTVDLARVFIGTNTGRGLGTSRDNGACPYLSLKATDPVPTRVLSGMWAQELVFPSVSGELRPVPTVPIVPTQKRSEGTFWL